MTRKALLGIVLIILVGALYVHYFSVSHAACVPLRGVWFRRGDHQRLKNIATALLNIQKYSPEDYDRVCERASLIRLASFKNQLVPVVPYHTQGTYTSDQNNLSAKNLITIDRDTAAGSMDKLEPILVHEACHAFLIQTSGDSSEPPCYSRAQEYVLKKPKVPLEPKSLEQRSAELIKQTGERFHAYCASRERDALSARGECVFINYTLESKQMCVRVFLVQGNIRAVEQEACGEVGAVGYRSIPFELLYPKNTLASSTYQFGFSPADFESKQ